MSFVQPGLCAHQSFNEGSVSLLTEQNFGILGVTQQQGFNEGSVSLLTELLGARGRFMTTERFNEGSVSLLTEPDDNQAAERDKKRASMKGQYLY